MMCLTHLCRLLTDLTLFSAVRCIVSVVELDLRAPLAVRRELASMQTRTILSVCDVLMRFLKPGFWLLEYSRDISLRVCPELLSRQWRWYYLGVAKQSNGIMVSIHHHIHTNTIQHPCPSISILFARIESCSLILQHNSIQNPPSHLISS